MSARIAASVVLTAGILLGTSACDFLAPQATTIHYDASDGVSGNVGDLDIRNAMLIADNEGAANLIVTVVNEGDKARDLEVQYAADSGKVTQHVSIAANSTVRVGSDTPVMTLDDIAAQPGSLFPLFMQHGDETGVQLPVPVLDGTLPEYSTLVPTPTVEPSVEPTPAQ